MIQLGLSLKLGLITVLCFLAFHINAQHESFYAYYTKIESSAPFEKYSRTSEHADIIVTLKPSHELRFWRGTSYLPIWKTPKGEWTFAELVPRKGNGIKQMPDATNMFSQVRIVKNSADTVIVMWRYLPNFSMNTFPHYPLKANPLEFTEETFTITSDGKVERFVKKGTSKINDWLVHNNVIRQTLVLSANGIKYGSKTVVTDAIFPSKVVNRTVEPNNSVKPLVSVLFDEGIGDSVLHRESGQKSPVYGHGAIWKKGVSGSALQFDGYTTKVVLNHSVNMNPAKGITLEGWFCVAAYPWNWVPFCQLGDSLNFALGINNKGYPEVRWNGNSVFTQLQANRPLNRNRWYYLAATFNPQKSMVSIFINGQRIDSIRAEPNFEFNQCSPIYIGMSNNKDIASDPVRPAFNFPTWFGFDGLMDELRIYDRVLTNTQIEANFKGFYPSDATAFIPDIEVRKLPQMVHNQEFGARYTLLPYYQTWDNMWRFGPYNDVVVGFDSLPVNFVFWRGTNYVPCIVNDKAQWFCNEFNETWGTGGGKGCQEPMSDKNLLTAHARIIEQSEARVVVHWRVALLDTKQNILANYDSISGWGDWSDWYYYIYPDGVAAKKMRLWTSGEPNHEWHESMVIVGENTRPEEILEQNPVYSFIDRKGNVSRFNWADAFKADIDYKNMQVFSCNFKSDWDPYTIGQFTWGNVFRGDEITPYSVFCNWNHWPTALINCDGRFSSFPDRASHTSLNNLFTNVVNQQSGTAPFYEKILLEGITNKPSAELYKLSLSWLNAPLIEPVSGINSAQFDMAQKAYTIKAHQFPIKFTLNASKDSPLVNPAFVVNAAHLPNRFLVFANGTNITHMVKQGMVRNHKGEQTAILWLNMEWESALTIEMITK